MSNTSESFAYKLNKDKVRAPKWFYIGERKYNVLHARLRMLCSPLNDHLYSHIHVVDSPSCSCGHPRENNKHFLIDCPLYINERNSMMQALQVINFDPRLKNLLQGNSDYSEETNAKAFTTIQKYLEKTGRFV